MNYKTLGRLILLISLIAVLFFYTNLALCAPYQNSTITQPRLGLPLGAALCLLPALLTLLYLALRMRRRKRSKLPSEIICPGCGRENRGEAQFCHSCGAALTKTGVVQLDTPRQHTKPLVYSPEIREALASDLFATHSQSGTGDTGITLHVGHCTDVGHERSLNEDSLLVLKIDSVFRSTGVPVGLFAVADGMGGHKAGDVASRLALQIVSRQAVGQILTPAADGTPLPDARQWLTGATTAANRAVYEQRKTAGTDMGTTLVMALFVGHTATIANVGDSRAYLLSQERIEQITVDHSLVERLVATGQITRAEAADHPQKSVIYRVIGNKAKIDVDLFEQQLAPGEALLMCSDGLSGMVSDEQIWQTWRASTSPQEASDRLVEAANQAGGEDNISIVIVQSHG